MLQLRKVVNQSEVETDYVLWTDPDVVFMNNIDSCELPRPRILSIGPESEMGGIGNCGVIYYNVEAYEHVFPQVTPKTAPGSAPYSPQLKEPSPCNQGNAVARALKKGGTQSCARSSCLEAPHYWNEVPIHGCQIRSKFLFCMSNRTTVS
jgi:hypothetical protein